MKNSRKRFKASLLTTIILSLILTACGLGLEQSFPLAEPAYNSKRPRDLTPFSGALEALTPERTAELDTLVLEKTIPDLQALMEKNQLTSEELVTYYLSRIQRFDIDRLNSVMELNPDALEIARALDEERKNGRVRGPMHGIPVLLKDNIATGDQMHTTAGAFALRDWRADRDAFLVKQLRSAGAVVLGKANLSEWANYTDPNVPNGFSTLGGQTRHPYGPFDPLGSSTGSAVSVAANLTSVSVGTETQGSLITPAASNGVVAIKTSRGLVSRDHIIPLVDWMDVPGPVGRTVTDVAVLLTAMSGVDGNDPATADATALAGVDFTQFAKPGAAAGKTVGIFVQTDAAVEAFIEQYNLQDAAADEYRQGQATVNASARQIGERMAAQGLQIVEIDIGEIPATPDVNQVLEFGFRDSLDRFLKNLGSIAPIPSLADVAASNNEDTKNRVPYGQSYITGSVNTSITQEQYTALTHQNQDAAKAALQRVFDRYHVDAIVMDTGQVYAAAGFPAMTIPNGLDENGQPTGVTLIGDFLGEPDLIAIGYAYEQAGPGRIKPDLDATISQIETVIDK